MTDTTVEVNGKTITTVIMTDVEVARTSTTRGGAADITETVGTEMRSFMRDGVVGVGRSIDQNIWTWKQVKIEAYQKSRRWNSITRVNNG